MTKRRSKKPSETIGPDREFTIPTDWLSSLNKLGNEALGFTTHVTDITGMVSSNLEMGRIKAPSNTISILSDQLTSIGSKVSSISSHIDKFTAIANSPSALLLSDKDPAYLATDLVIDSVGSILSSTASMATTFRNTAEQLRVNNQGQIEGLHTIDLTALGTLETPISADLLSQDTVRILGDRLKTDISTFNNLMDTSMAMSRLSAEIYAEPTKIAIPYLTDVNQTFITLNNLSDSIYNDLNRYQSIDTDCFLFQAPTIEPYAAAQVIGVVAGLEDEILDRFAVPDTDEFLDELGDELLSRLQAVSPELADVYREAIAAIESGHHGWIRHAGVSSRTLFDHLLRHLAPNSDLQTFLEDPESDMINGEFKRNARLRYIFRDIATGDYVRMAEEDIKLAEATFFPSNEIVHKLSSLSEKQMRVFWRRIQGCVSVVLEAAGH